MPYRTGQTEYIHDGGSNVTYLTGIFQQLLPDLAEILRNTGQQALARAEWEGDFNHLGIRSVQYLSFYKAGIKQYRQEKKLEQQLHQQAKAPAFVVFPDAPARHKNEKKKELDKRMKFDPDADEVVSGYLQGYEPPGAVSFSAVILLSDRSQFVGGEVLIAKKPRHRTSVGFNGKNRLSTDPNGGEGNSDSDSTKYKEEEDGEEEDEDVYSDQEEEEEEEVILLKILTLLF